MEIGRLANCAENAIFKINTHFLFLLIFACFIFPIAFALRGEYYQLGNARLENRRFIYIYLP